MKKIVLALTLSCTFISHALDTQEYHAFVKAIQDCDEVGVIRLKEAHPLTLDEKDKLSTFAYEIVLSWKTSLNRAMLFNAIPESLKKNVKKDYVQHLAGWASIVGMLAYVPGLVVISLNDYPAYAQRRNAMNLFNGIDITLTIVSFFIFLVRHGYEITALKLQTEEMYHTSLRIKALLEA